MSGFVVDASVTMAWCFEDESDEYADRVLLGKLRISVEHPYPRETWPRLLSTGRDYSISAHDAAYLELAMRRGLPLATRDARLREACPVAGVELLS